MPTNNADIKFEHRTRASFNSLVTKNDNTFYVVLESNGDRTLFLGNVQINGIALDDKLKKSGDTMTGKLNIAPSIAGRAGINIPNGVNPSAPVNGDIWQQGNVLLVRLNGQTQVIRTTGGAPTSYDELLVDGTILSTQTISIPPSAGNFNRLILKLRIISLNGDILNRTVYDADGIINFQEIGDGNGPIVVNVNINTANETMHLQIMNNIDSIDYKLYGLMLG